MPQSLDHICAFIDRHCAARMTVPRLAARAGMSTFHFIRVFRERTGTTPHQYLRARRLDRAKYLLVATPSPVAQIAADVGFRSLASFSRVFQRLTGETPVEWRRRRRRQPYIPGCFLKMYRVEDR